MMPYLDATLAFALTMLAIATLVTRIVDLVKNTTKVRRQGLQDMLTEYFKSEFMPVVHRELSRLKKTTDEGVTEKLGILLKDFKPSLVFDKVHVEGLVNMTTTELLEQLKRSEFGQSMLTDLGDKANDIFAELGKRYEVVGNKFTESFRKESAKWAFGIALILAFLLNVDSIYVINSYVNNANLSQTVIAQNDALVNDYNVLAEQLEINQGKDVFTKADLEQAFQDSRTQLNTVTSAGFPIGWSYFPYSYFQGENGDSLDFQARSNPLGWLSWIMGILITGVLAGLGGPFWYDAVASITRVVQGTRAAAKKAE